MFLRVMDITREKQAEQVLLRRPSCTHQCIQIEEYYSEMSKYIITALRLKGADLSDLSEEHSPALQRTRSRVVSWRKKKPQAQAEEVPPPLARGSVSLPDSNQKTSEV